MKKLSSREIALTVVFAAIYIAATIPPWKLPVIGAPKGGIEPSLVLGPIIGFVLGPYLGFIAAFLGAMIGLIMPPGVPSDAGSFLMPFAPAVSAFVAGSLTTDSMISKKIKGWMIGALMLFALILSWYIYFYGVWGPAWTITETKNAYIVSYPILHFTGLMIPLIFREKLAQLFKVIKRGKFSIPVALICWSAILSDHMLGNMIWITVRFPIIMPSVLPDLPKIFIVSIPLVLLERLTLTIVATVITVALIPLLMSSKLMPRIIEEA